MRVIQIYIFLPFIVLLLALNSCKPKLTHNDAVKYYKSVNNLVDRATQESSNYIIDQIYAERKMMDSIRKYVLNNSAFLPDTIGMELFKSRHQRFKKSLDSLINILSEIKETDKTIKLREKAIEYIKQQISFHTEAFQNNIEKYSGYDINSDGEKGNIRSVSLGVSKENLDQKRSDLIKSLTSYLIKYRISLKELKNDDL